ncbi:MAG: hypothetical protein HYU32_07495, partial [candidate division NC10 bacterium]|nr:hypothetical protein [candidate division NC10 bacterium]
WEQAVASYFQGDYAGAARTVEEAERIMPGFADLMRLRIDAGMRGEGQSGFWGRGLTVWVGLGGGLALALLAVAAWRAGKSRSWRTRGGVQRISSNEVRSRLDGGSVVTLVDARTGVKFEGSPVQAAGALRYDIERSTPQALQVEVAPSGEVIVYCD